MCKAQIRLQNKEVNFITCTDYSRYFTLEMYIFVKSLKLLRICKTNGANSGSIHKKKQNTESNDSVLEK